jgi:hypothetical protein
MDEQDSKFYAAQLARLFDPSGKISKAAREIMSQGLIAYWKNRSKWPRD